jgi:hypothetical protein
MTNGLTREQLNTAIRDPNHLLRWVQSERPWIVFKGEHLVKAMPWPQGHILLQGLIASYRELRLKTPSGDMVQVRDPLSGQTVEVEGILDETLSRDELDACIRWLVNQMHAVDPSWTL